MYIVAPSAHVDQRWQVVTDYQEQIMKVKDTPKTQV